MSDLQGKMVSLGPFFQKSFKKSVMIVGANSQSLELDLFIKESVNLGFPFQ